MREHRLLGVPSPTAARCSSGLLTTWSSQKRSASGPRDRRWHSDNRGRTNTRNHNSDGRIASSECLSETRRPFPGPNDATSGAGGPSPVVIISACAPRGRKKTFELSRSTDARVCRTSGPVPSMVIAVRSDAAYRPHRLTAARHYGGRYRAGTAMSGISDGSKLVPSASAFVAIMRCGVSVNCRVRRDNRMHCQPNFEKAQRAMKRTHEAGRQW
jgi:hypothetical protein